ncbi:MAG: hypothetical protein VKQ33_11650 [Candidatus Sericytochromatia bacterium]|nr:hypothetical protein [Candidatus Sericytochromatia bacterium]
MTAPSALSRTLLLAAGVAAGLAGCWPPPGAGPTPPALSSSPRPTPAPSPVEPAASLPPPSPLAPPTAGPVDDPGTFDLSQPLPAAGLDSTLEASEDTLVSAALASDELAGFLLTELVHDGGVVLFRTLAGPVASAGRQPEPEGSRKAPARRKAPVQRRLERKGERQLTLRQACEGDAACRSGQRRVKAEVVVRQVVRAQVTDAAGSNTTQRYAEVFRRDLVLRPVAGKMALDAVGPASLRSAADGRGLDVREVTASLADGTPLLAWRTGDRPTPVAQLPQLPPGAALRVRVRLEGTRPGGRVVLASFPGQAWDDRVVLVASGLDPTEGDFSGTITVPSRPGASHLLVEAVDARGLEVAGSYRSVGLGFSARIGASP